MPARCTARRNNPFRMSLRSVSCAARAGQQMPWLKSVWQRAAALNDRGVEGHGQATAVPKASLYLSALELKSSQDRESDQPGRPWKASAAKGTCGSAFPRPSRRHRGQGVGTDLCRMPGYRALCVGTGAHAVGADLAEFRSPQGSPAFLQGLPLQAKQVTAGAIERPEGFRATVHGAVCGGGPGKVCGGAVGGAVVEQAPTNVAVGEGDLCCQKSVLAGQAQEGKHDVHGLALRSLNSWSHMLPQTASRKVALLEAAVEQEPAVGQRQGLQLLHQLAGEVGPSIRVAAWKTGVPIRVPTARSPSGACLSSGWCATAVAAAVSSV
jgi:hypothetical protein